MLFNFFLFSRLFLWQNPHSMSLSNNPFCSSVFTNIWVRLILYPLILTVTDLLLLTSINHFLVLSTLSILTAFFKLSLRVSSPSLIKSPSGSFSFLILSHVSHLIYPSLFSPRVPPFNQILRWPCSLFHGVTALMIQSSNTSRKRVSLVFYKDIKVLRLVLYLQVMNIIRV